jgi:hypothetical protein
MTPPPDAKIAEILQNNLALVTLNKQANKLKHVRRLPRKQNEPLSSVNTSTSHEISEPTPGELIKAIVDALEAFRDAKKFPELSALNRPPDDRY